MRKSQMLVTIAIFLLYTAVAFSGDIYLLSINNQNELSAVVGTVDNARGRIGGKFIVEIDAVQKAKLEAEGISLWPVCTDCSSDRLCIVSRESTEPLKAALYFEPKYSYGNAHLIELGKAEADVLRKDGFIIRPISSFKTSFFFKPSTIPVSAGDLFPLDTLVAYVKLDSLYNYTARLQAFQTRFLASDSILSAEKWLIDKFREFGYTDISTDTFFYQGNVPCHNVMCYKMGASGFDNFLVVGAHYDSYNADSSPYEFAPGADDNASGTAIVLELARVLRDADLKKTILFAPFSAEELGLFGSEYMASRLYEKNAGVECMLNFDMVAYNIDEIDNVSIHYLTSPAYSQVMFDAASRVTTLIPTEGPAEHNLSDHASFDGYGFYNVFAQEGDFNHPGWHHDIDIVSTLNFPYFTEVAKMGVGTIARIDVAADPTHIDEIWDIGDGQSLRIDWDPCQMSYSYKILYGILPGNYTDTINISAGICTYDLGGLTAGQPYYFSVMGINQEGYGPIYLTETSGVPYIEPRAPANAAIEPGYHQIAVNWNPNKELDFNHYRLLRRVAGDDWAILQGNIVDSGYLDAAVQLHTIYDYRVMAIDNDSNESDSSVVVSAMAASFDYPSLFVDETDRNGITPIQETQMAFYDSILGDLPYDTLVIGTPTKPPDRINRILAGQYGSIIWFDDDLGVHRFTSSVDSIQWYLQFENNFCLAGWETFYFLAGTLPQSAGDFVYDNFGISLVTFDVSFDFMGASGQNGWPSVEVKPNIYGGTLDGITVLDPIPGAEVIYKFNSMTGDPDFQGKPVGLIYDTGSGKRVALGFPIYHLREPCARALVTKLYDYFGVAPMSIYGDVDNNAQIGLMDIVQLIKYLYWPNPPDVYSNRADPNGDCAINLADIIYLVSYLYRGGPAPVAGCVE